MKRKSSVVSLANNKVSILAACRFIGMDLLDISWYDFRRKVHCPFGPVYHSDLGMSPTMRIYLDSNSAFCFRCSENFSPVRLVALARDSDLDTAASVLLSYIGHKPLTQTEAWAAALVTTVPPDTILLAEALKVYCERTCSVWFTAQFNPAIAFHLNKCLALLGLVKTDADAQEWLDGCKRAMDNVLADNFQDYLCDLNIQT